MMVLYKQKKSQGGKNNNRVLVNINVLGSARPIRFVVNEDEHIAAVIATTLSRCARKGRLLILGSDLDNFVLYCPLAGTKVAALSPSENFYGLADLISFFMLELFLIHLTGSEFLKHLQGSLNCMKMSPFMQ
ncbi:hypothetical protein NMG60_11016987 [Bertholletia excelsa]